MAKRYEVVFYQDERGRSQLKEWLRELKRSNPRAHAKVIRMIEKLEDQGPDLRMPHAKHIKGPIWELRKDELRVYYWQDDERLFIAAAGEAKQRNEADSELIAYALAAHREWKRES